MSTDLDKINVRLEEIWERQAKVKQMLARFDKSDVQWRTLKNGVHFPVRDGVAVGGPLKGKRARESKANRTEKKSGKAASLLFGMDRFRIKRMSQAERRRVQSEINTYYKGRGFDERVGTQCGMCIGNKYYVFMNNGFNSYEMQFRLDIERDGHRISALERILK